ncbi:head scaffolding protein [Mycobacterium phage TChen]|uniref:Scaffolding protein n=2 Tax=Thetabobvirus TaxID=2843467 RepID=A0A385DZM1_9CAUD|nr:head scaffolding protein [Mycobacterium phage TChen]YP_009841030.1 head scaffolding protein [Mycobacterium phage Renaud18]UCR74381.1 scaffolding protein [Mycobacterium phage Saroj]UZV39531.1 scaffolding protein [Mycobacterium phage Ritam007]AWH14406.1 scaffolding protein [Mycobacterium phage TChen]AXQ64916.1 scaffolding protein [Mycobacterium phage Renaud18]
MSDDITTPETEMVDEVTEQDDQEQPQDPKPTETVEYWKAKSRENEKRAKANAEAAKRLAEIEDAQKSDAEKTAERISKAEAEVAAVPQKVAEALKSHLVALHKISDEDAELFLTATDPELLLKQVSRLVQAAPQGPAPNPQQGNPSQSRGGTLSAGRERYAAKTK